MKPIFSLPLYRRITIAVTKQVLLYIFFVYVSIFFQKIKGPTNIWCGPLGRTAVIILNLISANQAYEYLPP